ncbi:MAG TPA: hypothetical protein VKQ36_06050 [Ktedonobacterales bacterium]|nr:hypothetical protein [Ktedonobacterales bacterium]
MDTMSDEFGVTEYTLVFRRALPYITPRRRMRVARGASQHGASTSAGGHARRPAPATRAVWAVARPLGRGLTPLTNDSDQGVAQVFIVPICSTLALDGVAYEHFLMASGALPRALRLLSRLTFAQPQTAENARKQIQSLIMAAEVEYIVQGMSA